jgi:hypothetical protein
MRARARFREELQAALDKFDIHRAEALSDKLHDAEEAGYELTAAEEKLWTRLLKCIESFRRTLCSLD